MKNLIAKIYYKFFTKNKGLLKEEYDERDYKFGAVKKRKLLREDGQWTTFLPKGELQKNPLETMACVSFSLLNIIEILNKLKFKANKNYSDRFLAKCSGTNEYGNSMREVLETLRKYYGAVREKQYASEFSTWNKYYKAIPQNILNMGQLWIKEYKLEYESVNSNTNQMMNALRFSPLYVGGFAWYRENGIYQSYGRANHCFVIVGYKQNEYWLAFDSYFPFVKKLAWDYKFSYVKSIFLEKKEKEYNQKAINELMNRNLKYIMTVERAGEIFRLTDNGLEYISPKEWNNINVKRTAEEKQLIGITTALYNNLIK